MALHWRRLSATRSRETSPRPSVDHGHVEAEDKGERHIKAGCPRERTARRTARERTETCGSPCALVRHVFPRELHG